MNAQDADHGYILVETKTAYSRRNIKRSRLALGSLRHRCVRQQHECDVLGNVWNTATDMVIPNQIGGVMIAHNFSKRSCKRLAARPELPSEASFHELRHTAATLLLSRGVSVKVVSEILGRADSSVTLCIAVHVVPDIQLVAADVIDSMFASKG